MAEPDTFQLPCFPGFSGPLPNAQLLLFYGFTLSGNPFDSVPLGFELPDESEGDQATGTAALRAALLRWAGVGLHEHSLGAGRALSPRLLTALRLLTAPRNALERVAAAAGVTGAGALPTGVGAACAEGEGEEGALLPDPAAAAGTREGALRAAAVEAACGSEDAAAALEVSASRSLRVRILRFVHLSPAVASILERLQSSLISLRKRLRTHYSPWWLGRAGDC